MVLTSVVMLNTLTCFALRVNLSCLLQGYLSKERTNKLIDKNGEESDVCNHMPYLATKGRHFNMKCNYNLFTYDTKSAIITISIYVEILQLRERL